MAFRIEQKLVVGVSTNALFNLEREEQIFEEQGVEAFQEYQKMPLWFSRPLLTHYVYDRPKL